MRKDKNGDSINPIVSGVNLFIDILSFVVSFTTAFISLGHLLKIIDAPLSALLIGLTLVLVNHPFRNLCYDKVTVKVNNKYLDLTKSLLKTLKENGSSSVFEICGDDVTIIEYSTNKFSPHNTVDVDSVFVGLFSESRLFSERKTMVIIGIKDGNEVYSEIIEL